MIFTGMVPKRYTPVFRLLGCDFEVFENYKRDTNLLCGRARTSQPPERTRKSGVFIRHVFRVFLRSHIPGHSSPHECEIWLEGVDLWAAHPRLISPLSVQRVRAGLKASKQLSLNIGVCPAVNPTS